MKTRLQVQIQKRTCSGYNGDRTDEDSTSDTEYENALDAVLKILQEEGVCGLYSGLESSIAGTAAMNFAYFYWSAAARRIHQSVIHHYGISDSNSIAKELGLGAVAGAMAQLCTNPIAVISTRQQTCKIGEERKSMWETMKEIARSEDGWTGFWRGFKVNLILVVNPMITYGVYQWLREGLVMVKKKEAGALHAFCKFCLRVTVSLATRSFCTHY